MNKTGQAIVGVLLLLVAWSGMQAHEDSAGWLGLVGFLFLTYAWLG